MTSGNLANQSLFFDKTLHAHKLFMAYLFSLSSLSFSRLTDVRTVLFLVLEYRQMNKKIDFTHLADLDTVA